MLVRMLLICSYQVIYILCKEQLRGTVTLYTRAQYFHPFRSTISRLEIFAVSISYWLQCKISMCVLFKV